MAVEGYKVGLEVGRDGRAYVPPSVELSERREEPVKCNHHLHQTYLLKLLKMLQPGIGVALLGLQPHPDIRQVRAEMVVHEPQEGAHHASGKVVILGNFDPRLHIVWRLTHMTRMTMKGLGEMPIRSLPWEASLMSRKMTEKPRIANMI